MQSKRICSGVYLTPGQAKSPDARIFIGYTGWTAAQLQQEIARTSWRVISGDASVVFDTNPSTLWQRLSARQI